jgi:Protein of unknown function (DUF3043)
VTHVDSTAVKLRLPGRRGSADAADPTAPAPANADGELTDQLVKASGKGRPTPKRHEAQGRRPGPPPPPPTTRKEAYKRMREQQAAQRAGNRRAMLAGDESALPARDRGPVRKLVRDIVDSRRNVGGLFLVVAGIALVGTIVPNLAVRSAATFLLFAYFILLIGDSVLLGRRISRTVAERFPKEKRPRGFVWYGISRGTMVRRWRFPKPEVKVGAEV